MSDTIPPPLPPIDPTRDTSHNHYWNYHGLDTLLQCKQPITASQDEDLFIAVHQVCEIAFHQAILDLDRALDALRQVVESTAHLSSHERLQALDTAEACYFLHRVVALYGVANQTMPVLRSMRAFSEFRSSIGPTSGFQSAQFRRLEIMSGITDAYWQGGTRDSAGNLHPAEIEFNCRYGAQVAEWFERYRQHSLVHYYQSLCRLTEGQTPEDSSHHLSQHPNLKPLLDLLAQYDSCKRQFHQAHLGLAAQQLSLVGVKIGTGGTSFRDYLAKYNREIAPLFSGLANPITGQPAES
ncbi:MAG: tryptophan 2,3-dioxygenase family protein [Cyanobacteria bacterium P01_G01_bin.4]